MISSSTVVPHFRSGISGQEPTPHPSMSRSRGTSTNLTEVYSDLQINWAHVKTFPDSPSLELDSETSGHVCRWIQPPPGGLAQACFQTWSLVLCVSLRAELSPAAVCCFFKLPSSLWRLQFKAMEVEQLCKCQDTLRSCRHIIGDGGRLFKLVSTLCRNGRDVSVSSDDE